MIIVRILKFIQIIQSQLLPLSHNEYGTWRIYSSLCPREDNTIDTKAEQVVKVKQMFNDLEHLLDISNQFGLSVVCVILSRA